MINLFDRIYIRHDNLLVAGQGQSTWIITEKKFDVPYTDDKVDLHRAGIVGIHSNLNEVDSVCSGRELFWSQLRLRASKLLIIGSTAVVAELLIQYWKSIFKDPNVTSLYKLYELTIHNENLHSYRFKERSLVVTSPNATQQLIERLTFLEFRDIFDDVDASPALEGIEKRHIPFEYMLMAFMTNSLDKTDTKAFYKKVENIVSKNIVGELISARDDLFFETHNHYLLNESGEEVIIDDPLAFIAGHTNLKWALDPLFEYGKEDEVLAKYSMHNLKSYFEAYATLFRWQFDDYYAIDFLQRKDYRGLIDYDISDQKGNFFCSTAFVSKINGLLVSYLYQLKRLNQLDVLQQFQLK